MVNKTAVLKAVIESMKRDLEKHGRAAGDARAGATDSEVKSESKYDTRSVESSYLARGHAMHFEALQRDIQFLESYAPPVYEEGDAIGKGALVGLSLRGCTDYYFVLPRGGGVELEVDGVDGEITVMTPEAPLFRELQGKRTGDKIRIGDSRFKSTVASVW